MIAHRVSHILVPIDFSPRSEAALRYAKLLATSFGASLHLLHVLDDPLADGTLAIGAHRRLADVDERSELDAGTRLCNLLSGDEVTRFHATSALVFGSTAATITTYAWDHGIDLIVMGARWVPLTETVLGRVAECVVRTAHCPVLTVRDSGAVKLLHIERAGAVAAEA